MISEKRIPFSYKRLRYFLQMGIAWTALGMGLLLLKILFNIDMGILLTSIPFWQALLFVGGIHLLLWFVFKLNTYVIIDKKSIAQNNILSINRLFFDEITNVDEYAGDYTFIGKKKKIRLKKVSFTPDDHDIIKELAERLNVTK